jgi:hypothetical protein
MVLTESNITEFSKMLLLSKYNYNDQVKKMRWAGHLARMERGMYLGCWWKSRKERDHWEDQGVDNIKMNLRERERGWDGLDLSGSG